MLTHTASEQVSSDGYVARWDPLFEIIDPQGTQIFEGAYGVVITPWLDDTIIYEIRPGAEAFDPIPACTSVQRAFGLYNVQNNVHEQFCIDTPITEPLDALGHIQRNLFNHYGVVAENRYMFDLRQNDLQDVSTFFSPQVARGDVVNWVGHGVLWWNPIQQLPAARLHIETGGTFDGITQQSIQLCPMITGTCDTLVQVTTFAHGYVDDAVISPDGQSILWSIITFPPGENVIPGAPIGLIENVLAFETRVGSGQTTQIFDLSDYNTSATAKGSYAQWSADGRTLAISMNTPLSSDPDRGTLWVSFIPVDYSATLQGMVWDDANADGLQNEVSAGITNLTTTLYDGAGTQLATTTTAADGSYSFDIEPGLTYRVGVTLPPDTIYSPANMGADDRIDSDVDPTTGLTEIIVLAPDQINDTWDIGISSALAAPS